jgi:Mg-chelatase subunit ChlD
MFNSFRRNLPTSDNQSTAAATIDTIMSDDFICVNDETEPCLSLKLVPKHDVIGTDLSHKSVEFCATVTARNLPEDSARAPVDIVVALDISGSMFGNKLDLCKTTLSLLIRELSSSDRFGLVTFGSDATLVIPTRKLAKENREFALAKIKGLRTNGMTNMSGGIGLAAQEMKSIEAPHEVRSVFLLTDGRANQGISTREGIVQLVESCLGSNSGHSPIPIHCFGYGDDHDVDMLRDISSTSMGGTYYYVDKDSNVSSAFGDALGGVLSVVAQNAIVNLHVPSEAVEKGVSILNVKHDNATKNEDGSYSVSLNDFYAEESRDIIFDVALSDTTPSSDPFVHITSSVSYLDTINIKLTKSENVFGSITRPLGEELSPLNTHVAIQCIRIKTTDVISESEKLADNGDVGSAKSLISAYIIQVQKEIDLIDKSHPFFVQILNELDTIMSGFSSQTMYERSGAKYTKSRIMSHKHQRCSEVQCVGASNVYANRTKVLYSKKMKNASMLK